MTYIRFDSHRQRDKALRSLLVKPQAFYSLERIGGKGIYLVTDEQLAAITRAAKFARLRGPFDDLRKCWG